MTEPAGETIAERLQIGALQLIHRMQRIDEIGVTVDDLEAVADYLRELAEHGCQMAHEALEAVEDAPSQHPVVSTSEGMSAQVHLGHVGDMFGAIGTFAINAHSLLRQQANRGAE